MAQKQVDVAEQGLITDRITKAVEGLGAEKTISRVWRTLTYEVDGHTQKAFESRHEPCKIPKEAEKIKFGDWNVASRTVPNIEVRIGAIYALERISQDSDRDHVNIMEILCAYIRENAPAASARTLEQDGVEPLEESSTSMSTENSIRQSKTIRDRVVHLKKWTMGLPPPRSDIGVALNVIGRRSEDRVALERSGAGQENQYFLDLKNTNLQKATLYGANLEHALLTGSYMEGADLDKARLTRAHLRRTHMNGASLKSTELAGCNFGSADLIGSDLSEADCRDAFFANATLDGASLMYTNLQDAKFLHSTFKGGVLGEPILGARTHFSNTSFCGTAVKGVDLDNTLIDLPQIDCAFGDGTTNCGDRCRPAHWPTERLDWGSFLREWSKWLADPASYVPPQDRA